MKKKDEDDWRATSIFVQPETSFASTPTRSETSAATSAPAPTPAPKKQTLLVDLHEAAAILGIPFTAVRRLIAEDQIPATRAGRGGKFMIARTAIAKYAERIK
jgi:excisionase family DNA binding protein